MQTHPFWRLAVVLIIGISVYFTAPTDLRAALALSSPPLNGPLKTPPAQDGTQIYLPLVQSDVYFPVELVQNRYIGYGFPSWDSVYGHVQNLTTTPLYSVTLEMDVRASDCHTGTCSYWSFTERFTPTFAATLPGQINPFTSDSYMQYKSYHQLGTVRVVAARPMAPTDPVYQALTIERTRRDGGNPYVFRGVARNDTDHILHEARVVAHACGLREATLDQTTLSPGEETAFHFEFYCDANGVVAVGQGVMNN